MKQILLKQSPIQLEQQDYQKLREQVLRRDGWRCQSCGSMTNLEVHHREFRSHCGADDEMQSDHALLRLSFFHPWLFIRTFAVKREFVIPSAVTQQKGRSRVFSRPKRNENAVTSARHSFRTRPHTRAHNFYMVIVVPSNFVNVNPVKVSL